jgi:hypothetical protein
MKIDKATLEELKQARPSGIFEGVISFNDDEDRFHEVEFIYRKPTMADVEAQSSQRSPIAASLNLIQALIVYPEPGPVIEALREYRRA